MQKTLNTSVKTFLGSHCANGHGGTAPAAQLNLTSYATLAGSSYFGDLSGFLNVRSSEVPANPLRDVIGPVLGGV